MAKQMNDKLNLVDVLDRLAPVAACAVGREDVAAFQLHKHNADIHIKDHGDNGQGDETASLVDVSRHQGAFVKVYPSFEWLLQSPERKARRTTSHPRRWLEMPVPTVTNPWEKEE